VSSAFHWCVAGFFGVFCFVFQCSLCPVCPCGVFGSVFLVCASVRVEGKLFQVSGEEGAAFLFRVSGMRG